MKEKNLPKLKKEIMKLFGSSLSLDSNININTNSISLPSVNNTEEKESSSSLKQPKSEDINISIVLPDDKKTTNYKKTIKSLGNGKTYNLDIKKNNIPLVNYLNTSEDILNKVEFVKPLTVINYDIFRNTNTTVMSPHLEDIVQNNITKENVVKNTKNEYLKEYVKILENYKNSSSTLANNINNTTKLNNTFYEKPYNFLTNTTDITFNTNTNKTEILSPKEEINNFYENNKNSNTEVKQNVNSNTEVKQNKNVNLTENISSSQFTFFEEPIYYKLDDIKNVNQNNLNTENISIRTMLINRSENNIIRNKENTIPAFEKGGIVKKPTLSLIGEKEPEVIIPQSKLKEIFNQNNKDIQSSVNKEKISSSVEEFVKTGDIAMLPVINSINENGKMKDNLDQETLFANMSNEIPKFDRNNSRSVVSSVSEVEQSLQKISKTTNTIGIKQLTNKINSLPNWRSKTV
jgi:hypothetical protein